MNINSFYLAQGTMNLNSSDSSSFNLKTNSNNGNLYTIADYNGMLGNLKTQQQALKDFQTIADKTTDPEEKQRYTDAVKTVQELIPQTQKTLDKVSSYLKLDPTLANSGKVITPDAYKAYVANGYQINGDVLSGMQNVKIPRLQNPILGTENDTGFTIVA